MAYLSRIWALISSLGILMCSLAVPANAMSMLIVENESGKSVLLMYGGIEPGDHARFRRAVKNAGSIEGVWLSSGGGLVSEAAKIGNDIRQMKIPIAVASLDRMSTAVSNSYASPAEIRDARRHISDFRTSFGRNYCASACGMLLASGYIRFVDEPYSVGLHSTYYPPEVVEHYRETKSEDEFAKFLQLEFQQSGVKATVFMQDMGIDVNYASIASVVPAACMYWLSAGEMDELNVVNVRGHKTQGPSGSGRCSCGPDENARQCEMDARSAQ